MSKKLKLKKIGNMSDGNIVFCIKKQKYRGELFGTKSVFYSEKADVNLISSKVPTNVVFRYQDTIALYVRGSERRGDYTEITCTPDDWKRYKKAVAEYNATEIPVALETVTMCSDNGSKFVVKMACIYV